MSHRKKHKHKPRHRTHTVKPANLLIRASGPAALDTLAPASETAPPTEVLVGEAEVAVTQAETNLV